MQRGSRIVPRCAWIETQIQHQRDGSGVAIPCGIRDRAMSLGGMDSTTRMIANQASGGGLSRDWQAN